MGTRLSREERRSYLLEMIGGERCRWCRSTENIVFDHIWRDTKLFNISAANYPLSERVFKEVRKCQPLCERCHRIKTVLEVRPKPEQDSEASIKRAKAREWSYKNQDKVKASKAKRRKPPRVRTPEQEAYYQQIVKDCLEQFGFDITKE